MIIHYLGFFMKNLDLNQILQNEKNKFLDENT